MITGHSTMRRVAEARDAGVNELLAKPVTARGVIDPINLIIEHPRPLIRCENYFGPDRRRRPEPGSRGRIGVLANRGPWTVNISASDDDGHIAAIRHGDGASAPR
ncbi:hypothetical protein [Caulobacter sp. DWR3-1-2]